MFNVKWDEKELKKWKKINGISYDNTLIDHSVRVCMRLESRFVVPFTFSMFFSFLYFTEDMNLA